jgi:hypothetical protein
MSNPTDNINDFNNVPPEQDSHQNSVNSENAQPNPSRREETRASRRRSERYYSQFHINQFYDAAEDEQYYTEEYVSFIQTYGQFVANSNAMFSRIEQGLRSNITRSITREYFYYNRYNILRGHNSNDLPSPELPMHTPPTPLPTQERPSIPEAPRAPPAPPAQELPSITRSITTALLDIMNRATNTRASNEDENNNNILLNRRNNANNNANNNNANNNNANNNAPRTRQNLNRDHSNQRQPYAFFFDLTAGLDGNTVVNNLFNDRETNVPTREQIRNGSVNTIFSRISPPQRNTVCAISHEEFTDTSEVTHIRGCSHIFKPSSLARWFQTSSTCPMCRYDIRDYREVTPPSNSSPRASANPTNIPNRRPDLATITSILTNNNNINDIYNRIIDNSSNFTNAVIENINDDEITFSYDLPSMPGARFNRMIENNENDNNENNNNENDNNENDLDYNDIEEVD